MYKKFNYSAIGFGVLRASVLTILFVLIYSLITSFLTPSDTVTSVVLVIATLLSVAYGSVFAALKIGSKGWLVGLLVAFFYIGRELSFQTRDIVRLILALVAGSLSGMLGVNL